jgi:hypothetical protein
MVMIVLKAQKVYFPMMIQNSRLPGRLSLTIPMKKLSRQIENFVYYETSQTERVCAYDKVSGI